MADSSPTEHTESTQGECNICLETKECFQLPCGRCPAICMTCINTLARDLLHENFGDRANQFPEETRNNRYGNCQICRKVFVKNGTTMSRPRGKCYMCGHNGMVLAALKFFGVSGSELMVSGLCDNCWVCEAYPETYTFQYECDRCHNFQIIPHPMYRYQPSPEEYGGATWACHQACHDYTHWKIRADQVAQVPNADKPQSWN